MDFALNIVLPVVVAILAFGIGWIVRSAARKDNGTLHVVEFENGTFDMLIEIKAKPKDLINGQDLILTVHKTRG